MSEIANLRLDSEDGGDVDLDGGVLRVMGKGRRQRIVPIGNKSVKALDRYVRLRARHPHASLPWLWIARRGQLTGSGIQQMTWKRSADAGIPRVHPHSLRHSFAHHFLNAGWAGGRPNGARRLAVPSDGDQVRGEHSPGTRDCQSPAAQPRGPALEHHERDVIVAARNGETP